MLIDLEDEPANKTYESQVCVLGAGIAGLILAQRLARRRIRVHLLEAGGLELEPRSQALYETDMAGQRHAGATEGRFRVFGGSSTRWGGQLLPYTEDVFRPASGMPSAAWPIGPEAIEPYYAEVQEIMGADALPFDGPELLHALRRPKVEFGDALRLRFSKWAPFGRRNLASTLGRDCLAHNRVTVFTHANAVSLEQVGGKVAAALAKNYAGAEFCFRADHFVICLGTIESSRFLLASGTGNAQDQVGRYFHDHVSLRAAAFQGAARALVLQKLGPFFHAGTMHTCKLEASAELRQQQGLPAVMAHVVIEEPEDSGVAAVRRILRSLQRGDWSAAARSVLPLARGVGDVVRLVWGSKIRGRREVTQAANVWLHIDMEQVATAEDRIRLSETRDALGQPRALIDWRVGDQERQTAKTCADVMKSELETLGISGLRWLEGEPMTDTYHPMGGLRMGANAHESVVDRDLRVHGTENLYVASCAVFPSGGSSNPTFTMMALTLRLVDKLAAMVPPPGN